MQSFSTGEQIRPVQLVGSSHINSVAAIIACSLFTLVIFLAVNIDIFQKNTIVSLLSGSSHLHSCTYECPFSKVDRRQNGTESEADVDLRR